MRMRSDSNVVRERSFELAVAVVRLCTRLQHKHEYILSKQLLRSGTSIGANIEEALAGHSRRDFLAKMVTAHKEARETHYWLRLIRHSQPVSIEVTRELQATEEVLRLLSSITKTTRQRSVHPPPNS